MTASTKPIPSSATCIFSKRSRWPPCTFACGGTCPISLGSTSFFTEATTRFRSSMFPASGTDSMANPSFPSYASNYGPLSEVSAEGAKDLLLEEIGEYLPITPADVESWELNSNTDVPLFINTIGAWPNRPRPKSKIKNLYLAGDFVKNAIDLACMEGAVSAALETAASDPPRPRRDRMRFRWLRCRRSGRGCCWWLPASC